MRKILLTLLAIIASAKSTKIKTGAHLKSNLSQILKAPETVPNTKDFSL